MKEGQRAPRGLRLRPAQLLTQPVHRLPDKARSIDFIEVILGRLQSQSGVVVVKVKHTRTKLFKHFVDRRPSGEIDGALQVKAKDESLQLGIGYA